MVKVILKLELHDDKDEQKAMKIVSGISGVESISLDTKDKKLTLIGDIDPVKVAAKLRKLCYTEILSVGPAKEPEKKKDEPKKEESKKVDPKDDKKKDPKEEAAAQLLKAYQAYYQHHQHHFPPPVFASYTYRAVEEDPNACVFC